jgi:hypothetical protein
MQVDGTKKELRKEKTEGTFRCGSAGRIIFSKSEKNQLARFDRGGNRE